MELTIQLFVKRSQDWQKYIVKVSETAYVLDVLEAAWRQDNSLLFRHSCHHASCGSCGMLVNGKERLACETPVVSVMDRRGAIRLEPLYNFPLIGDLVVDTSRLMVKNAAIDLPLVRKAEQATRFEPLMQDGADVFSRFENCIECGLCVSACPIAAICPEFLGPAALAAAERLTAEPRGRDVGGILDLVSKWNGLWRCHQAFECSQVCPADVDPSQAIRILQRWLAFGKSDQPQNSGSFFIEKKP